MKAIFGKHTILPTLLTVLSILAVLLIPSLQAESDTGTAIVFLSIFTLYVLFSVLLHKEGTYVQVVSDITSIILIILLAWELTTNKFGILTGFIYPTLAEVIDQFRTDAREMVANLWASVDLLFRGYLLAVALAIPSGILSAWVGRLEHVMRPIASVLAPIPPIVLTPYAIALFPTFKASSTFIIFIGAFWPIFVSALNGVAGIDRRYIDSARTLGVSPLTLFRKIIFPATLPSIFTGLTIGMILSFILLTAAEMIGANAGIGWYVKMATDFGDYTKVVAGIIFIGFVVTVVMTLLHQLERYLLRWRKN